MCVCVREREGMCVRERRSVCVCVCVCVREREREREGNVPESHSLHGEVRGSVVGEHSPPPTSSLFLPCDSPGNGA